MSPRVYRSTRRAAQAQATREAIVAAAARLFAERGYAGTTMRAVAEAAEVAVESVYAVASKPSLLLLALTHVRGGETLDHPMARRIAETSDQREQIRLVARFATDLIGRVAPLERAFATAAETDPQMRQLWGVAMGRRLADATAVMGAVAANGPLRVGVERAGQTLWAIVNADTWHLSTQQLGWTESQFADWLEDILVSVVLK
ncbi:TetR/AcrR family transcriptional regulator [Phytohabitans aurantiacus]|uniref:TetR family transcriptional regulator n=1 Tax=Phytohabitans aurantiacus TaxID=3016789 RepID=A0ABQ5QNG5_9ACTN|nr:TetR family transcriptional regulator [Phytohabitans aurantiacus]GLH95294.1 TetR family transcriptional regulator [Phytohabitans aurantiacus]